jgi:hypothetical protein
MADKITDLQQFVIWSEADYYFIPIAKRIKVKIGKTYRLTNRSWNRVTIEQYLTEADHTYLSHKFFMVSISIDNKELTVLNEIQIKKSAEGSQYEFWTI